MKLRALLFGLGLSLLVLSCKKSKDEETSFTDDLKGTWELTESYSGMSPLTTYKKGNGNLLRFDSTKVEWSKAGQVVMSDRYHTATGSYTDVNSCAQVQPTGTTPNLIFYGTSSYAQHFEISNGKLTITSGCIAADGGYSKYRKIQEGTSGVE